MEAASLNPSIRPAKSSRQLPILLTLGPGLKPTSHGDVVVFDWEQQQIVDQYRYQLQVHDQSHKGLAGATWHGNQLLVALEAELLTFDVAPFRLVSVQSHPALNDVHYYCRSADRFWVCNTGLDAVEEFDLSWTHVRSHDLIRPFGRDLNHMFDLLRFDFLKSCRRLMGWYGHYTHLEQRPWFRNIRKLIWPATFRNVAADLRATDLRPHVLHPNHLQVMGDDLWVTLWRTGEIVSLKTGAKLASELGRPHDGVAFGDEFFVTDCAANRLLVYAFDPHQNKLGQLKVVKTLTQNLCEGFLRGVAVIEGRLLVGFSARRNAPTDFQCARIVELDRQTLEPIREWSVPRELGQSVFSILPAGEHYSDFVASNATNEQTIPSIRMSSSLPVGAGTV